ncbi:MAG: hypothetical protein NTW87_12750 [Planctomycetota bacterium]|nr:hypothetical protein [Planctomycetota bacterium]
MNWCDAFGMGGDRGMGQLNMPLNTACIPPLEEERPWALLLEELTFLKVACVRFLLPPDGFITKRGTMDFDCVHFERLERLCEWAGANGASIVLDTMYVPRYLQVKGEADEEPGPDARATEAHGRDARATEEHGRDARATEDWAVDNRAPANSRMFAEHFAGPLLDYCISERGWTQIRYYSPVNEPLYGGIFGHPKSDPFRAYAHLLTALREELIGRNLVPQRLSVLGPGSPSVQDWPIPEFDRRGLDLTPLLDAYDQHEYCARFDDSPPNANAVSLPMTELINRHLIPHIGRAKAAGKPFLITELGHVYYGSGRGDPNGPATHEAFLLDAEFAVRTIPLGVQGLLRWSFLNPGDIDGRWQLLESADGSYRRAPHVFPGYATLIRYARPHSDVLEAHTESSFYPWPHIHACALRKMPQGDFTLLVVNDHDSETVELRVKLPASCKAKKLSIIRTDRILKHYKTDEIKCDSKGRQFSDQAPPRSLNVYTSLEYDPGVR